MKYIIQEPDLVGSTSLLLYRVDLKAARKKFKTAVFENTHFSFF